MIAKIAADRARMRAPARGAWPAVDPSNQRAYGQRLHADQSRRADVILGSGARARRGLRPWLGNVTQGDPIAEFIGHHAVVLSHNPVGVFDPRPCPRRQLRTDPIMRTILAMLAVCAIGWVRARTRPDPARPAVGQRRGTRGSPSTATESNSSVCRQARRADHVGVHLVRQRTRRRRALRKSGSARPRQWLRVLPAGQGPGDAGRVSTISAARIQAASLA
jgi:hypothetical protein